MKTAFLIAIIIFLALFVRIVGIDYGLPFAYHDDEPIIVNYALSYGSFDFNPHTFRMSPLISYALFFIYGLFFSLGFFIRYFHNVSDLAYLYLSDPTIFYLIARLVFGVACGTLSVFVIYKLARKYFNERVALLSALFLALNYLHVRDSHYIYFDIPLMLFSLIFFYKIYSLLNQNARRRDYIQLGLVFGICCSIKYSGILLGAPLFAGMAYNFIISGRANIKRRIGDILSFLTILIITLFILNPFALLDFRTFLRDFSSLPFIPMCANFHLKVSLLNGCGIAMLIAGLVGAVYATIFRRSKELLFIIFGISYYFVINRSSQPAERLVLLLIPVVVLFAAYITDVVVTRIKWAFASRATLILLTIALVSYSSICIYYSDGLFLKKDTRTLAYEWIGENIAKETKMALDATASYFPRLKKSRMQLEELLDYEYNPQLARSSKAYDMKIKYLLDMPETEDKGYYLYYLKPDPRAGFFNIQPGIEIDYDRLKKNGVKYLLLSNILLDDSYKGFVRTVEENAKLIKTFSPYKQGVEKLSPDEETTVPCGAFMLRELKDRTSYGPVIKIYRL